MRISKHMDLYALAELMGKDATPEEAERMREQLLLGCWADTEHVGQDAWHNMLEKVAK